MPEFEFKVFDPEPAQRPLRSGFKRQVLFSRAGQSESFRLAVLLSRGKIVMATDITQQGAQNQRVNCGRRRRTRGA
jgi:hypothetical protein